MRYFIFLLIAIALGGCVSQVVSFEEHKESLVGGNIVDFIEGYDAPSVGRDKFIGSRKITKLNSGGSRYEFPYPKCPIFIITDDDGVIQSVRSPEDKNCY